MGKPSSVWWCLTWPDLGPAPWPWPLPLTAGMPAALWASRASVLGLLTAVDTNAQTFLPAPRTPSPASPGTLTFSLLRPGRATLLPSANQAGSKDNPVKFLVLEGYREAKEWVIVLMKILHDE